MKTIEFNCDRCGKRVNKPNAVGHYDFCDECFRLFYNWLHSLPSEDQPDDMPVP